MRQTFTLPIPPSANRLWRNVGGRTIKSREYREWEDVAGMTLRLARPRPTPSPAGVHIRITGGKGFNRNRDADNAIKATLDLLRHGGVLGGDSVMTLHDVRCSYAEGPKGGDAKFEVDVFTLGEEPTAVQS
jgi:Holliday junction resolvase RusA-like endonuclease